jgi:Protein of unknown function (DUF3159)
VSEQHAPATVDTVEAVVRRQMAQSLGGRRGIIEGAIPGILFTVLWLITKDVRIALIIAGGAAVAALLIRIAQRSTIQFAANALVGIAIGWVFVRWAASSGGSEQEQALAYFLPGILWTTGYTILLAITCLVGWPMIGFLVGSVSGDPTAWHHDKQIVKLCSRLTWLLLAPGAINVLLQGPVWVLGWTGAIDVDLAVAILGVLRLGVGWTVRIAAWAAIVWLLARNKTPVESPSVG